MARNSKELYLDFGNEDLKWCDGGSRYGYFRHAFAPLTDAQWRRITRRNTSIPRGYLSVNGVPYAIGEQATRHTIKQRPVGASRYERDYYGIGLAGALIEACPTKRATITLYASHAPQDIDYAQDLEHSASGEWHIESFRGEQSFTIRHVDTMDEPFGGLNHYILTKDGRISKKAGLSNVTGFIVDVGGHTVDTVIFDPGYNIDLSSVVSTRAGTIGLVNQFVDDLRANNRTLFKSAQDLSVRKVDEAILTGVYKFGNQEVACYHEASEAKQALVYEVSDVIETASGGIQNLDVILLTGGGSALIEKELIEKFPRIDFIMVERDRDLMRYANVLGMKKGFALMERAGGI